MYETTSPPPAQPARPPRLPVATHDHRPKTILDLRKVVHKMVANLLPPGPNKKPKATRRRFDRGTAPAVKSAERKRRNREVCGDFFSPSHPHLSTRDDNPTTTTTTTRACATLRPRLQRGPPHCANLVQERGKAAARGREQHTVGGKVGRRSLRREMPASSTVLSCQGDRAMQCNAMPPHK